MIKLAIMKIDLDVTNGIRKSLIDLTQMVSIDLKNHKISKKELERLNEVILSARNIREYLLAVDNEIKARNED